MPPALTAVNPPLGPQPQNANFYHPREVTLAMREKVFSLTGDDFTVRTVDGVDVMKCKAKLVSIHGKKKFSDMQDNEIYTLGTKMLALHKSFTAESPSGHGFEIKGKFKLMGSKSEILFKNASTGTDVVLELVGDWLDKSAEIKYNDQVIASISRKFFNAREFFGDKQTYFVAVAPNVDLSLIAGVCVSLDERENESD